MFPQVPQLLLSVCRLLHWPVRGQRVPPVAHTDAVVVTKAVVATVPVCVTGLVTIAVVCVVVTL